MAKSKPLPISFTRIISGIADYDKETVMPDGVAMIRQIDYRTNPRKWKLLPRTTKESGSVIVDLPLWGDRISTDTYIHGDTGRIYKRTSAGSVTLERAVANSHGNGLKFFGEDQFLYYPTDISIGRYGRIGSTPSYVDDYLTAEGGVPLNTHSLDLEASSSHYASMADSASLSQTGDISIEINFKPESLPSAGNEMVLVSKWKKQSDDRSYKLAVYAVSGYFGDGSEGALTISSNTTEAPIDSACSGTSGTTSLSATNASFAVGQIILIHQTRGTGAGTWQRTVISGYTAGTITTQDNLNFSYSSTGASKAQVRVLKQYTDVTINSGITYTAKAWDGTVGGILALIASGTITGTGTFNASAKGFRGASQHGSGGSGSKGYRGEGTGGDRDTEQQTANGNGGGGGEVGADSCGGGGGNGAAGGDGQRNVGGAGGAGGTTAGSADLTTMVFGGGGGSGMSDDSTGGAGGTGGGIIFLTGTTITISGAITTSGSSGSAGGQASGGSGAGGSVLLKAQTATLGSSLVTASGAGGVTAGAGGLVSGAGGSGRIHLDYLTSYTGTTSPTLDVVQDNNLVTNVTYQLRFSVSSTGANEENLSKNLVSIAVGNWGHYAVSFDASDAQAELFEDGNSLGTATGTLTSIDNNTSLGAVGASYDAAGAAENFADGKVDDMRIWSTERTAAQISANRQSELVGTEAGLVVYHQFDNSTSDSASSPDADNLTLVNSPSYSTDVPFSAATTRLDIDQEDTSTGATYAVPQAIDEGASHRQTFVPAKDPQKSIGIYISDTGDDSDWTVYVHDAQNRLIASKTLTHAQLSTGHNEFIFSDPWTPIIGASYHFHIVASTATGTPLTVSGSSNNLETQQFKSYYQFLVEDIYHPIEQTLNFLSVGNGRYVAKVEAGNIFNPHRLTFPSGWRVRCIAKWREYFAYGCWKGDAVTDYDQGIIFFWDGISDTYNFFIEVPEGAINSMLGAQGTLYIVAGYQGDILEYTGGDKAVKVKRLPKMTADKYIEVLPGAITMWRTLLHIGAGVTDSDVFEQGVYSWGSINRNYPDSLSFDHIPSTGSSISTGVKIGLLMPVDKKLLMGWKDGVGFGLDSVNPSGSVYPNGSIEWLIRDEGALWKEKKPDTIRADFDTLITGHSVSLQYKLDRNTSWSVAETASYDSDPEGSENKILRVQPNIVDLGGEVRHREYQVRLNLATSVSTSPAGLGVTIMEDALTDENFV